MSQDARGTGRFLQSDPGDFRWIFMDRRPLWLAPVVRSGLTTFPENSRFGTKPAFLFEAKSGAKFTDGFP